MDWWRTDFTVKLRLYKHEWNGLLASMFCGCLFVSSWTDLIEKRNFQCKDNLASTLKLTQTFLSLLYPSHESLEYWNFITSSFHLSYSPSLTYVAVPQIQSIKLLWPSYSLFSQLKTRFQCRCSDLKTIWEVIPLLLLSLSSLLSILPFLSQDYWNLKKIPVISTYFSPTLPPSHPAFFPFL